MHAFSGLPTTHSETACCFSPDESLILTGTSAQRDGTGGALLFFDVNKYVWLSALNVVLLLHIHCLFFWFRSGVCFAGVHSLTVLLVHIHCLFCWRAFSVCFADVHSMFVLLVCSTSHPAKYHNNVAKYVFSICSSAHGLCLPSAGSLLVHQISNEIH